MYALLHASGQDFNKCVQTEQSVAVSVRDAFDRHRAISL